MRVLFIFISGICLFISCSEESATPSDTSSKKATQEVPASAKVYEVGCGLCVYDSEVPDTCESYVKVEGKVMPIVGKVFDAHSVGLCEYKGTAFLSGKIEDGKFMADFMKIKEFDKTKDYQD